MKSDRWRRLEELFDSALELPEEERPSFLETSCGSDGELRRMVEDLLRSDGEAGAFMSHLKARPTLEVAESEAGGPRDGRRVGPYRLLRKIGEGGMSTVYLAERDDESFRQRVAVKVVREGMESAETRRRLRVERQILASLDHPYIARFYEGGTTGENLPYFVLGWVDGIPIDEYCDSRRLTVSERLELFRRVCSAVTYAHHHLVVHRDLKPSNILVTEAGEPKLLDFGIAKLLEPERLGAEPASTAAWVRWLTPHYASPEQIRGERVTTASDVYSLGVLLYQLLTGRLPFDFSGKTRREVEETRRRPPGPSVAVATRGDGSEAGTLSPRRIAELRSSRPAQLVRTLAGDLDTIVLKALQEDPRRRYSSAEGLADDLRRFERGFPVRARPDHFLYRAGKFLRRHRLAVSATVAFVVLLTAGTVALALQSARLSSEREQLRAVIGFVKDVFQVSGDREELTLRQAVDRSSSLLVRRLQDQPEARATLLDTMGTIYLNLWALEPARTQLEEAVALRRERFGNDSLAAAESLSPLGLTLARLGRHDEGERAVREAVAIYRRTLGPRHADLVRPLNNLVDLLCSRGAFDLAHEPSAEALDLARELLPGDRLGVAKALANRAFLLTRDGERQGEELYREALELYRRYHGEERPEVTELLNNLATATRRRGDLEVAEELYRRALDIDRRLFESDSVRLALTLNNLAFVLLERGDHRGAAEGYREAASIMRGKPGPGHLFASAGLAESLLKGGEAAAAEELLQKDLDGWRQIFGDSWAVAYAESLLGESLLLQGRYEEAGPLLERSYAVIAGARGEDDRTAREARRRLAELHERAGGS